MNLAVGLFHLLMISAVFSFEISNVINPVLSTKVDEVDDRYVMRFVDRCSDDVCQLKMSVKFRDLTSAEILAARLSATVTSGVRISRILILCPRFLSFCPSRN